MKKTMCELFAGVGGFRLGLEKSHSDWETVFANQWEPKYKNQFAYKCYIHNFGESEKHSNVDIADVDANDIADFNLLVGGFPCQDYSVATTGAKGLQGKKGVLWWEIFRVVKEKKPPYILLENVDRLLKSPTSQRGRDFGIILSCLHNQGYGVEWRVINAADYGMPQKRRRVFIFAFRNTTNYFRSMETKNHTDIVYSDGIFPTAFPVEKLNEENPVEGLSHIFEVNHEIDIQNISDNFKLKFENSGIMMNASIMTVKTSAIKEEPVLLKDILEQNVDEKYYLADERLEKFRYQKCAKAEPRIAKNGHEYMFREGAVPFPDNLDSPARTMLTSESKLNRSTHVILDPETNRLRVMTPVECERANMFEDNWTNYGLTDSQRYFCMGNALVVGIVKRLGEKINSIMESQEEF